jgi:lipopolysaccharide export system protein LptA
MRWQKAARLGVAAFVIVFTAVVVLALRKNRTPPPAATSPRTDPRAVAQAQGGIDFKHTVDGKVVFAISAEANAVYPDGRTRLTGKPVLTLPDRNGRTLQVTGEEIEIHAPPDRPQDLKSARVTGNVRFETDDGLVVRAAEAAYDNGTGVLTIPGRVEFSRLRTTGTGTGATYDKTRDVLWLLADARVTVAPDEKGAGALEASAGAAGFARGDHYTKLTGSGRIEAEGRTIEAAEITIHTSEDDKLVRTIELRGSSRITATGSKAGGAPNMAANDIDLVYGEDGRTLQRAKLVENASVELPGSADVPGRRVAGRTVDISMSPDGATVTGLQAAGQVRAELPGTGDTPSKRIDSATLDATGAPGAGLRRATFAGGVVYRETRAARGNTAAVDRTARSQRLMVDTKPGLGAVELADFRGDVRFDDGRTHAEAPRARYRVAEDAIDLSPFESEPGPAPRLNDGQVDVRARAIGFGLSSRQLIAETDVRSSITPAGASKDGRLPSMLDDKEPVLVSSNRLEYDGATSIARYTGSARLWQGRTFVNGDAIQIDDRAGNLTAQGKVRTEMFFDDVNPKTKARTREKTTATADAFAYDDAARTATYTADPTGVARMVGPQGDVTAARIDLLLRQGARELERAEADGNVVVKEGDRTARGKHLTYTAADETYVMTGTPVQVDELTPPNCRRTFGVTLTFRRAVDTLDVVGIPGTFPMKTITISCTPERSH